MNGKIIYIMGVSGSGKTTVGQLLALQLGIPFFDGDDFHPIANKAKMKAGIPLLDADRIPWLQAIHTVAKSNALLLGAVIACSALKEMYRIILSEGIDFPTWIYLEGDYELILQRLLQRPNHFMPAALLQSQFDILEKPLYALTLSIQNKPKEQIKLIMQQISLSELGIVGLGVMGKSLAINFATKAISISVFNRHLAGKEENIAQQFVNEHSFLQEVKPFDQIDTFIQSLAVPRKIILMVNAGKPVDDILEIVHPLLSEGDIIIDCGNSHYIDTARRIEKLSKKRLHFMGAGISGGEEGALKGPSIMLGGNKDIYNQVKHLFHAIAAKDLHGNACCNYIGADGAGHFVKMVHNGIEYAEMQLLAELYFILRKGLGKNPDEIGEIFKDWNKSFLKSYLVEITIEILSKKNGNKWLIDDILDVAVSKGTGSWATQTAAYLGTPATMLTAALFARHQSAEIKYSTIKTKRKSSSFIWQNESNLALHFGDDPIKQLAQSYQLARIINHHQGFAMIQSACKEYHWNIDLQKLAAIWTNGCIIRSVFMEQLATLPLNECSILSLPELQEIILENKLALATITSVALINGISIPALSASLNFLHAYYSEDSPMNIIQAQRDYFGAHGVVLKSDPNNNQVHINWICP